MLRRALVAADEMVGAHAFRVLTAADGAGLWPLGWSGWEVRAEPVTTLRLVDNYALFWLHTRAALSANHVCGSVLRLPATLIAALPSPLPPTHTRARARVDV